MISLLFLEEKGAKTPGTRAQQSFCALFRSCRATSFSLAKLATNNCSFKHRGWNNSLHAITTTYGTHAQTYFILFPMFERLFAVLLTVPEVFWNYLCTRYLLRTFYCFDWAVVFAYSFQLSPFPRGTRQLAVGRGMITVSLSATDYLLARITHSKTTAAPHNFSSAQW